MTSRDVSTNRTVLPTGRTITGVLSGTPTTVTFASR